LTYLSSHFIGFFFLVVWLNNSMTVYTNELMFIENGDSVFMLKNLSQHPFQYYISRTCHYMYIMSLYNGKNRLRWRRLRGILVGQFFCASYLNIFSIFQVFWKFNHHCSLLHFTKRLFFTTYLFLHFNHTFNFILKTCGG